MCVHKRNEIWLQDVVFVSLSSEVVPDNDKLPFYRGTDGPKNHYTTVVIVNTCDKGTETLTRPPVYSQPTIMSFEIKSRFI